MAEDTIAAIATPSGSGGIGIIRISGSDALHVLTRLFRPASPRFAGFRPWVLHRGTVCDASGRMLDDALAVFMPAPQTFTGEPVAELQCHGGTALLEAVLEHCLKAGARLADRGEFTRRAFLNGRIDLTQAEAIAEMIAAPSQEGARLAAAKLNGVLGQRITALRERLEHVRAHLCLAVDFPDEEVECLDPTAFLEVVHEVDTAVLTLLRSFDRARCWREGIVVALAGAVNAGKSSLMNAFLGRERAIVTEHAGTTRDFLEESVRLAGLPARLIDTAGLRETDNPVEAHGIRLGRDRIASADVVLLMIDGLTGITPETHALWQELDAARTILVWNKADLATPPTDWQTQLTASKHAVSGAPASTTAAGYAVIAARNGDGLEGLAEQIRTLALAHTQHDAEPDEAVPNLRQSHTLEQVHEELQALAEALQQGIPYDVCAVRLESAASALAAITGLDTPDDVLNRIFDSFCIGK